MMSYTMIRKETATTIISVFYQEKNFITTYSMSDNSIMGCLQELRRLSKEHGEELHNQAERAKPFSFNDIFAELNGKLC